MDIDSIAATIRLLEDIIVKGIRHITLRSGVIKSFRVHPSWLQVPWQGKVTDLSQAYKQLFVSLKDRWAAVISVFDPNSIPTRSEQNFLTSIFAVWRSWVCEPFLSSFETILGCRFGYWPNLAELLWRLPNLLPKQCQPCCDQLPNSYSIYLADSLQTVREKIWSSLQTLGPLW